MFKKTIIQKIRINTFLFIDRFNGFAFTAFIFALSIIFTSFLNFTFKLNIVLVIGYNYLIFNMVVNLFKFYERSKFEVLNFKDYDELKMEYYYLTDKSLLRKTFTLEELYILSKFNEEIEFTKDMYIDSVDFLKLYKELLKSGNLEIEKLYLKYIY